MKHKGIILIIALATALVIGGGVYGQDFVSKSFDTLYGTTLKAKTVEIGGDPLLNQRGTSITGSASGLTDLDSLTIPLKSTAGTRDETGGNGNAIDKYVGVPKIAGFAVGASIDGTAQVIAGTTFIDESPAGEWVGTTNVTDGTSTTIFRKGTGALSLAVVDAAVAGNGADNTLAGGDQDWSADESVGVWIYSTVALTAGDLVLEITDGGAGATTVNLPAVATANQWTWCEIDISGVADASKDVITTIAIDLSTAGAALGAFTVYLDGMAKWDAANEEAIGQDIYEDGVIAVFAQATAAGSANTVSVLADQTDYIIHYESGNDFFIAVSNQSAASIFGLAAVE